MTARLLAVLAVLALPTGAAAKGIARAEVCGTDRCIEFTDAVGHAGLEGTPVAPPEALARFVELNYTLDGVTFTNQLELSGGLIRGESGTWMRMPDDVRSKLKRLAVRVEAFPAQKLLEVAPELAHTTRAEGSGPPGERGEGGAIGTLPLAAIVAAALAAIGVGLVRRRAAPQP
jgi:hypothetical protein